MRGPGSGVLLGCHDPHSAVSPYLFAYDAKSGYDLCIMCHKTKFGK
jgi:predicted CXXCH cytochrome family protein